MSVQVPYYDAGHRLLAMLNPHVAERYVAQKTATAIRKKDGTIRRLYRRTTERVYGSIDAGVLAMRAASQTTRRLRYGDDELLGYPKYREHRKPDAGWPGARHDEGEH